MRHTMGQDWGGRIKRNPENCPRITRKQVEDLAKEKNVEVSREGKGMWFFKETDGFWKTLGLTNYIAYQNLMNWY